ncbi:hypothetical protein ABBQ32_004774 [Trebouxia sp. C0010 RCD-2024]
MTSFSFSKVCPSANVHMIPLSTTTRACPGLSRRSVCQQVRRRKDVRPALRCMAAAEQHILAPTPSKATLRKCTKAQLVSHAQQLGIDDSGTKNTLVERLLATFSTAAAPQPCVPTRGRKEEVQKLQAEVAELDSKLIVVTQTLIEATAAREEEREQLATVIADMAIMRERWQTDVRQVEELALIAGGLEHSEREILNLRSQQGRFEERVAMMQGLLKEREQEISTLNTQLSEFRQPAMAMAGASTAGATSWSSDTAAAAQPLTASSAYSSWANNWNTAVVQSGDGNLAGPHAVHEGVTQSAVPSHTRDSTNRQHGTPGLAIVAAVGAAAERGSAAWGSVKSLLPQDKRILADAVLAAGATALLYRMYS